MNRAQVSTMGFFNSFFIVHDQKKKLLSLHSDTVTTDYTRSTRTQKMAEKGKVLRYCFLHRHIRDSG